MTFDSALAFVAIWVVLVIPVCLLVWLALRDRKDIQ